MKYKVIHDLFSLMNVFKLFKSLPQVNEISGKQIHLEMISSEWKRLVSLSFSLISRRLIGEYFDKFVEAHFLRLISL